MQEESGSNDQENVFNLLSNLTGHLYASNSTEEDSIISLQQNLAAALLGENIESVKNNLLAYENSDLFFTGRVPETRLNQIKDIIAKVVEGAEESNSRVFVRESPIRSSQIKGSIPVWAQGAAIEKTLGPFTNKDGKKVWFDFFKIEKLIALYLEGESDPAILFNVSLLKRFVIITLPPIIDPAAKYKLLPDSVWINSKLLAANSPDGYYTGLKIKSGEITLNNSPKIIDNKLTATGSTIVTVNLVLDQPGVTDADNTSPYGIDARNSQLNLPANLNFHFSKASSVIDSIEGNTNWIVYGDEASFAWDKSKTPTFNSILNRVLIPFSCSEQEFTVKDCKSTFNTFAGSAEIISSAWAIPSGQIDITKPSPAAGIGGMVVQCKESLTAVWSGLKGGKVKLSNSIILADIGRISITDFQAGNIYCNQEYKLWKNEQNKFGSTIKVQYTDSFPFIYYTFALGAEMLTALVNTNPLADRPVKVCGQPFDVHSKNSILVLGATKALKLIYLYDDNIILDNYNANDPSATFPKPVSIALTNALFKVTPVNGSLLFGELDDDWIKVSKGVLYFTFGMYAYLPTLPDPYAANLNQLKLQFRGTQQLNLDRVNLLSNNILPIWALMISQTTWMPDVNAIDKVDVSFHFAPLTSNYLTQAAALDSNNLLSSPAGQISDQPFINLFNVESDLGPDAITSSEETFSRAVKLESSFSRDRMQIDNETIWNNVFRLFLDDVFALLDVSSNADQMGISFASFSAKRAELLRYYSINVVDESTVNFTFPIQAQGMDVATYGLFAKVFALPQISWEPVINTSAPSSSEDPPIPLNYYPNDGGAARILNNSVKPAVLAPLPLIDFVIDKFNNEKGNITANLFSLPFGMKAITALNKDVDTINSATIEKIEHEFSNNVKTGLQIQFNAGTLTTDVYPLFHGGTFQLNNIVDVNGVKTYSSTLGDSVSTIFNNEFVPKFPDLIHSRGVPLTRYDLSGYGANICSNWFNPDAQFAQTSQAKFDVFVGRTSHEVIQVRSIIYPWGIHVVRTIILYRSDNGYVYRVDTGWKAESKGIFDFSYKLKLPGDTTADPSKAPTIEVKTQDVFEIHPGIIKGLYNVKNIIEQGEAFPIDTTVKAGTYYVDSNNKTLLNSGSDFKVPGSLKMVEFDCDVEIEGIIQGGVNGMAPSKKMRGYVQLAPMGIPLSDDALYNLHTLQGGSIGGPVDCVIDIGKNAQLMRVHGIDSNNAYDKSKPIFSAAARGNIILPKEGSWSMVKHEYDTGDVTPLPEYVTIPLIRIGEVQKIGNDLKIIPDPINQLLRIANPTEILRDPTTGTINFGYLQTTDTQKALFLTPAYQKLKNKNDRGTLFSKTLPLLADAYHTISSKGIFPNISNAVTDFGDTLPLDLKFTSSSLKDVSKNVFELIQINDKDGAGNILNEGFKLLKNIETFDFSSPVKWSLIDEDYLKIYVEYQTNRKVNNAPENKFGKIDFDINSFENKCKTILNEISMVLDLGPLKRLMIIKGNFNYQKGSEASFKGNDSDNSFPAPQVEFSDAIEKVKDILQILEDLQGEDYAAAVKDGLKIAMSNSADSWEYKFEATKEIPVVKFPVPDWAYNAPNTPLKLEAYLKLGIYFNSALKVTTDVGKLLPTAGAFLDFGAKLSVACVSLELATVYAVGQADLQIGADTKLGPNLRLKFGFGAQIVVGLPVVLNVSVLYVVAVEIYLDKDTIEVSASLMFQGHADLLGGIVGITITIEAKGSIIKTGDRTDCSAQVTFAIDISIFLVIDIDFSTSWQENRQIA